MPNVVNYVNNHFGCNNDTIGALLAGDQSHWDEQVYYDEFLTPTNYPSSSRISGLTLNFLLDTNFYE